MRQKYGEGHDTFCLAETESGVDFMLDLQNDWTWGSGGSQRNLKYINHLLQIFTISVTQFNISEQY